MIHTIAWRSLVAFLLLVGAGVTPAHAQDVDNVRASWGIFADLVDRDFEYGKGNIISFRWGANRSEIIQRNFWPKERRGQTVYTLTAGQLRFVTHADSFHPTQPLVSGGGTKAADGSWSFQKDKESAILGGFMNRLAQTPEDGRMYMNSQGVAKIYLTPLSAASVKANTLHASLLQQGIITGGSRSVIGAPGTNAALTPVQTQPALASRDPLRATFPPAPRSGGVSAAPSVDLRQTGPVLSQDRAMGIMPQLLDHLWKWPEGTPTVDQRGYIVEHRQGERPNHIVQIWRWEDGTVKSGDIGFDGQGGATYTENGKLINKGRVLPDGSLHFAGADNVVRGTMTLTGPDTYVHVVETNSKPNSKKGKWTESTRRTMTRVSPTQAAAFLAAGEARLAAVRKAKWGILNELAGHDYVSLVSYSENFRNGSKDHSFEFDIPATVVTRFKWIDPHRALAVVYSSSRGEWGEIIELNDTGFVVKRLAGSAPHAMTGTPGADGSFSLQWTAPHPRLQNSPTINWLKYQRTANGLEAMWWYKYGIDPVGIVQGWALEPYSEAALNKINGQVALGTGAVLRANQEWAAIREADAREDAEFEREVQQQAAQKRADWANSPLQQMLRQAEQDVRRSKAALNAEIAGASRKSGAISSVGPSSAVAGNGSPAGSNDQGSAAGSANAPMFYWVCEARMQSNRRVIAGNGSRVPGYFSQIGAAPYSSGRQDELTGEWRSYMQQTYGITEPGYSMSCWYDDRSMASAAARKTGPAANENLETVGWTPQ